MYSRATGFKCTRFGSATMARSRPVRKIKGRSGDEGPPMSVAVPEPETPRPCRKRFLPPQADIPTSASRGRSGSRLRCRRNTSMPDPAARRDAALRRASVALDQEGPIAPRVAGCGSAACHMRPTECSAHAEAACAFAEASLAFGIEAEGAQKVLDAVRARTSAAARRRAARASSSAPAERQAEGRDAADVRMRVRARRRLAPPSPRPRRSARGAPAPSRARPACRTAAGRTGSAGARWSDASIAAAGSPACECTKASV